MAIEMTETIQGASNGSRCRGTNRRGQPCQRRATDNGCCVVHAGKLDMRAIGRRGGQQSVRSRLGLDPEVADGRLRKKAKARLEELLDSDDETKRLAAARALYSVGPQKPPPDEGRASSWQPPAFSDSRRITSLADVIDFTAQIGLTPAVAGAIERAHARLMEYQAQRTEASVDKFLADVDGAAKRHEGGGEGFRESRFL
jgi:hypothetical protein